MRAWFRFGLVFSFLFRLAAERSAVRVSDIVPFRDAVDHGSSMSRALLVYLWRCLFRLYTSMHTSTSSYPIFFVVSILLPFDLRSLSRRWHGRAAHPRRHRERGAKRGGGGGNAVLRGHQARHRRTLPCVRGGVEVVPAGCREVCRVGHRRLRPLSPSSQSQPYLAPRQFPCCACCAWCFFRLSLSLSVSPSLFLPLSLRLSLASTALCLTAAHPFDWHRASLASTAVLVV